MTKDIDVNSEPLPGYRLIERIGSGGYGEVWRAEAPGGLTKAIKFIFGQQHEKRAMNESRALDHIRGVRHPFLLSLERIEVINGRLLIVTELADGSVKDRFELCRRDNLRGIPRDELLGYLRDAADALDFMSSAHSLQHLDIKPENLLLLADHVKVADFGLVKDVRQSQASLVGGMTPLYAAPEVFRGSPSSHSDQYSLAIVYQEMLTGTLPFVGNNAAELTLQHLNEEPDLSALPAVDRYAVSRALSKEPEHRFASCRELIDSLFKATTTAVANDVGASASQYNSTSEFVDPTVRETQHADFFGDDQATGWNVDSSQMLVELPPSDCRLVDLPALDLTGRDARSTPTLVLGIGGTAGLVLSHLRRMMSDQWGSPNDIPAVQFLLVDTDSRSLADAARGEANGLTADEVLSLPLRRPQHYRENSQQLLHWLSRRWLYNIPRSLRTEGLRPLGRLALADQARQAGQRLRRAMVQALDTSAIVKSAATSGQEFRSDALRVIVVASISGGTGGGMSLDLGYAARAILQKLGLAHTEIIGLMMHSTGRDARHGELARVNAYSWLTEYKHFQKSENPYPGDVSCGLPSHAAGVPAFDHTYLLQLGENLESCEFEHATQAVAEYIRLNALSTASAFFDMCRNVPQDGLQPGSPAPATLRSFGVYRQTAAPAEFCDEFASEVSQHVLSTWRGIDPATSNKTVKSQQAASQNPVAKNPAQELDDMQLIHRLKLDANGISANARSLVQLELGTEPTAFIAAWLQNQGAVASLATKNLFASLDQLFGESPNSDWSEQELSLLGRVPASIVKPLAEKLQSEVRRWVVHRIDMPRERLAGTRRALGWIVEHLGRVNVELQRLRGELANNIDWLRTEAISPATGSAHSIGGDGRRTETTFANKYFSLRLEQVVLVAAQHVIHVTLADTKAISDEITALGREIDQIAAAVGRSASARASNTEMDSNASESTARGRLVAGFRAKLAEVANQIDARLQAEYLDANDGLAKTIMQGGRVRAQLTAKLHELSRKAVYQALAGVNVQQGAGGEIGGSPDNELHTAFALATPALLEYGGGRRVLAMLPVDATNRASAESVSQSIGTEVTAVQSTDCNLTLCVEADGLSLEHIALDFVGRRRDRVEFASRVHCRTDVAWTPLVSTEAPSDSAIWNTDASRQTQSQHAMCKTLVM